MTEPTTTVDNVGEIHEHPVTSLHAAASDGSIQAVQTLIGHGCDINSYDELGETALHRAVEAGHLIVTEFLVNSHVDVNAKNSNGETALHITARHDDHQIAELLVAAGADINTQDSSGCTALHVACQKHSVHTAVSLLHCHAALDVVDNTGDTALHKSCRENLLPIVETMCAVGSSKECPVNLLNKAGQSALHLAARVGNAELVRCLLLSGADIDLVNKDGVRAEDIALGQGHTELADFISKISASMTHSKHDPYLSQLLPTDRAIWRIKVKLFGSCSVGKSTLIGSLKCGYIRGLFRQLTNAAGGPPTTASVTDAQVSSRAANAADVEAARGRNGSSSSKSATVHENCTRCIDVSNVSVSGAGDLSMWEFSGFEPYYVVYDHFVGDPNCIHVVVFRASDPLQTQLDQLTFWLDFLRARIAPAEPIGFAGTQLWAPRVLLVATHADRVALARRNSRGETEFPGENGIVTSLQKEFGAELLIAPRIYTLDARQAAGADMKALKAALGELKQFLCQYLPPSLGFLDSTVTALPSWTRLLGGFPVVRWPTFVEYIRSRVHILATENHLQELICQLQLMGEVVYIESDAQDLIVLDPGWLFRDVIVRLLSPVVGVGLHTLRRDGVLSIDEVTSSFPGLDIADLTSLLVALELCSPPADGGSGYHLACLDERAPPSVDNSEIADDDGVGARCGGVELRAANSSTIQLRHVFRRVQQALWNRYHNDENKSKVGVAEWSDGISIRVMVAAAASLAVAPDSATTEDTERSSDACLNATVSLADRGRAMTVVCIGGDSDALYRLQTEVLSVILKVIEASCPGMYVERAPISPRAIKSSMRHRTDGRRLRTYTPRDVVHAMLTGEATVSSDSSSSDESSDSGGESLVDLVAFGSANLYAALRPVGPDLHVSHLSIYARCRLAAVLDPVHPLGRDWCLLAVALGLTDAVPQVDSSQAVTLSRTDAVLAVWSHDTGATVRRLYDCLSGTLQRPDVAEQLLALTPIVGPATPAYRRISSHADLGHVGTATVGPKIDGQNVGSVVTRNV